MRPYLAIIKDSFREAMVSKVLWVLLVLATFALAAVAPIGLREQVATVYAPNDFIAPKVFLVYITMASRDQGPSPAKRVWELQEKQMQQALRMYADQADQPGIPEFAYGGLLTGTFNAALEKPDLYKEEYWKDVPLPEEAQALRKQGLDKLTKSQLQRFNRLALDAAFPAEVRGGHGTQVLLSYLWWQSETPLTGTAAEYVQWVLSLFVNYFLGVGGVLIAVLVTAAMIPRAFEAGSIDLLLSKPVSRSGVFLAKFFGGCAFVTLIAAYFIGGLWLLVGVRHGLWNPRLLLCVPLLLFLFSIYYAVSALSSLLWHNAIISVVMTVVFWGVCVALRWLKTGAEFLLAFNTIIHVVPTDGQPLIVDASDNISEWEPEKNEWGRVSRSKVEARLPIGVRRPMAGGTLALFEFGGETLLMVMPHGVAKVDAAKLNLSRPLDFSAISLISPPLRLQTPFAAAMSADRKLAIFDGQQVYQLALAEGKYAIQQQRPWKSKQRCVMAYGGNTVLLAFADGQISLLDDQNLATRAEFPPDSQRVPRMAYAAADGRHLAVVLQDQTVWLYDAVARRDMSHKLHGQGSISAFSFSDQSLYVADAFTRVTEYRLADLSVARVRQARLSAVEWAYWYLIRVPYKILPKPDELSGMVHYLVTGKKTVAEVDDLEAPQRQLNVWQPFWSNLAFVAVMLLLSCGYVSRKDF